MIKKYLKCWYRECFRQNKGGTSKWNCMKYMKTRVDVLCWLAVDTGSYDVEASLAEFIRIQLTKTAGQNLLEHDTKETGL